MLVMLSMYLGIGAVGMLSVLYGHAYQRSFNPLYTWKENIIIPIIWIPMWPFATFLALMETHTRWSFRID